MLITNQICTIKNINQNLKFEELFQELSDKYEQSEIVNINLTSFSNMCLTWTFLWWYFLYYRKKFQVRNSFIFIYFYFIVMIFGLGVELLNSSFVEVEPKNSHTQLNKNTARP